MGRPKTRRGERRIDVAIDHLAQYGFPKPQIRRVINDLLLVLPVLLYGRDGWVFLEDAQYHVVLEKLWKNRHSHSHSHSRIRNRIVPNYIATEQLVDILTKPLDVVASSDWVARLVLTIQMIASRIRGEKC